MDKLLDAFLGMGAAAGPVAAVFIFLWWQERSERKELSAKVMELAVSSRDAVRDSTAAITGLAAKIGGR